MPLLSSWRAQARRLKWLSLTVYYAARDARMPWPVRLLALLVAAYAMSPIDLVPDFIPVLGYLDDLLLIPLPHKASGHVGVALPHKALGHVVVRFTPPEVMEAARAQAEQAVERPVSRAAAAVIILIWLLVLAAFIRLVV